MTDGQPHRCVVIKLSGESLGTAGVDTDAAGFIAREITQAHQVCPRIALVVGAGNLLRGARLTQAGLDRLRADYAGMVGTVLNALVLQGLIDTLGVPADVWSAFPVGSFVRPFQIDAVRQALGQGRVALLAGGTGNPLFTTDSAAALRAAEIPADILLKATTVDGVYADDPKDNPDAERFQTLSFFDVLQKRLRVMDWTAVSLCMEHDVPIRVFKFDAPGNLRRVVAGENLGTLVR